MNRSTAYVGLGSNQANPLSQLQLALEALAQCPHTDLDAASAVYRSRPVGPADQPDYLNMAVRLLTGLSPLELLDHMQTIEQAQGRLRTQHWGPRTLDLDLLLFDQDIIDHPRLRVPHAEICNRDFVLQPLLDIAPQLTLPDGQSVAALRQQCPDNGLTQLEKA